MTVPDEVSNNELARRIDALQSSIPTYLPRELAEAQSKLLETKLANIESDLKEIKDDLKRKDDRRSDDRRQYVKMFVGALLAAVVPVVLFVISTVQGVP